MPGAAVDLLAGLGLSAGDTATCDVLLGARRQRWRVGFAGVIDGAGPMIYSAVANGDYVTARGARPLAGVSRFVAACRAVPDVFVSAP